MSLNVYIREQDIPKGMPLILRNDTKFDKDLFFGDLNITPAVINVMKILDNAEYAPPKSMKSRFGNFVDMEHLSTGAKTIINTLNHPESCISAVECGDNAVWLLLQLNLGNVLLTTYPDCRTAMIDAVLHFKGKSKHFTDLCTMLDAAMDCWGY